MEPSEFTQGYYEHPEGFTEDDDHNLHQQDLHDAEQHDEKEEQHESEKDVDKDAGKNEVAGEKAKKEPDDPVIHAMVAKNNRRRRGKCSDDDLNEEDELRFSSIEIEPKITDPSILAQIELMEKSTPTTDLEIALSTTLDRKQSHIDRLTQEIIKLKQFISKRKQTYKRKRKDDGAPTRALSAYNIFIQVSMINATKERFFFFFFH